MAIGSVGTQPQPLLHDKPLQSTDSSDDELGSFDPRFSVRKLLIERMFGVREESRETLDETMSRIREDSVEISTEAISMYRSSSLELTAKTADGGEIKISYGNETGARVELATQETQSADPLVLDLDGDGMELTNVGRERG